MKRLKKSQKISDTGLHLRNQIFPIFLECSNETEVSLSFPATRLKALNLHLKTSIFISERLVLYLEASSVQIRTPIWALSNRNHFGESVPKPPRASGRGRTPRGNWVVWHRWANIKAIKVHYSPSLRKLNGFYFFFAKSHLNALI